ncbi:bifunctional sugar phosphate isomerase/epimerase/4-hydroxyphenylpyruvate dioxygenase family protein [Streptomyces sp. PT12]|uniref:bifunctional sugar phosphate isomerase/epimerase/4-hydroxyphenylpyruvate dioxygenase family protein n=1 Tax=Streptomyces sp. PT12 TaxID=1510197 RepID=UPI000DE41470|nr:sugar phosphate isomerase/epimerase and 4-hydroxyphenylpyruvate domain-containing protein [Streptomyces sp. PT12]RBM09378.1 4-hydroxyphenylpyruvate dioxygenase [Streptomyces sp. PT12]
MRTSIATVSLSGSLSEKLAAAAAAGFDGVEIFENDLIGSPLGPEEVRSRAADLGLAIDLYQPFRDAEAVPADVFARNIRRAEHKFRLMRRIGVDLLLVCSSVSPDSVSDDALAAEQLHALATRAAEHGVRIAYEALAWGRHVHTYEHAWRIVRAADHPSLGVCLDSFHILSRGSDPRGIEAIPGEKIFFLQLADAPLMAMDVLQWSRHYRCFPGQGGFDVAGLVRHAMNAGYQGPLSLEVFNDVFRQADAGRTAVDAQRSLLALEESAGLTSLPAAVVPRGIAFAELATADSEPLRALLTTLGFARTGRHARKPVELWEQGEARVLLTTGGPARREGPGLAAIGLETPDPAGAIKRAEPLLAPIVPRRTVGKDVPLDVVAAPDGTELFFCRTLPRGSEGPKEVPGPDRPSWTRDFVPAHHDTGDRAGSLTHIDHVALTQPWHRFDEAALFYRTVLGLQPRESVDLVDPYGLFRSRAVANPEGTLRLVLNVAPGPGAQEARPQHIAFATDDIAAVARRLREHGTETLPIPTNYYDDLAALHDLSPATLDDLSSLGILYDRDEHGEFRHLYTATYGHVFFEIVQRTGGYRGYGARNATVRLAAQHTRQLTV